MKRHSLPTLIVVLTTLLPWLSVPSELDRNEQIARACRISALGGAGAIASEAQPSNAPISLADFPSPIPRDADKPVSLADFPSPIPRAGGAILASVSQLIPIPPAPSIEGLGAFLVPPPPVPVVGNTTTAMAVPPPPMLAKDEFATLPVTAASSHAEKLSLQQLIPQMGRPDPSVPMNSAEAPDTRVSGTLPRLRPELTSAPAPAENLSESKRAGTATVIAQDVKLLPPTSVEAPTPGAVELVPVVQSGDDDRFTGLPRDYHLGPGDQISVIDPSLGSLEAPATSIHTIGPDGTITIYPVGVIRAAGLSIPQLNDLVNQKAAAFIRNPRMSIALIKARPVTIYVLGDVLSPGMWSSGQTPASDRERQRAQSTVAAQAGAIVGSGSIVQRQGRFFGRSDPSNGQQQQATTITQATPTLYEPEPSVQAMTALTAIQLAGGIRETADIRKVTVRKQGTGRIYNVDLWKLLALGDFEQDVLLQSGDVVFVPRGGPDFVAEADRLGVAANQFRYVRVWGEVKNPGLYVLGPKDDAFSMIARAGGFTDKADLRKFQLSRVGRDGTIAYSDVPLRRALTGSVETGRQKIMPGDVLIARPSYIKKMGPKIAESITVLGGAILLLYLSRTIKDRSQPDNSTNTTVSLF